MALSGGRRIALGRATRAVACLCILGCSGEEPPDDGSPLPASIDGRTNLLLVVIDTLRTDHLSAYGYARATSPHLAALAARGTLFEHALSQFQETRPSHVSLMTGLYPDAHGVTDNDHGPCPQAVTTLAEILAAQGFATAAIVGNALLAKDFALDQGFASYDDRMTRTEANRKYFGEKSADKAVDAALAWLRRRPPKPFFLFLHLQDPHGPYVPPEPFASKFEGDGIGRTDKVLTAKDIPGYQRLPGRLDHDHYIAQYDGEIAFADAELGRLFAALDASHLSDSTLVVFTADHGEALGERGLYYLHHAPMVFEEILRQPLILAGPGIAHGRRVTRLVQEIDVLPTLLEHLNLEGPDEIQGHSFASELDPAHAPPPAPPVTDAAAPIRAEDVAFAFGRRDLSTARTSRWKLIAHPSGTLLFDLANDPEERTDVLAEHREIADQLLALLERRKSIDAALRKQLGDGAKWTPEEAERDKHRLDALGYSGDKR